MAEARALVLAGYRVGARARPILRRLGLAVLDERVLQAEGQEVTTAVVPFRVVERAAAAERRLGEQLGEDAGHGRVVHEALQLPAVAVAAPADDLGLQLRALGRAQHGRQQDPAAQVEEELLLVGHRHGVAPVLDAETRRARGRRGGHRRRRCQQVGTQRAQAAARGRHSARWRCDRRCARKLSEPDSLKSLARKLSLARQSQAAKERETPT